MKILVTGASGYVGSVVCQKLMSRTQNYEVIAVDRNAPKHNYFSEHHRIDFNNIHRLLLNVDCVVHCAATSLVGPSVTNPGLYYKNNVASTQDLMDACIAQGVNRFVFISSAACYGIPDSGICDPRQNNTPINPYGWSKRMTEIMLSDYATAYGLNSVSLRLFNVAGAHDELGQEKDATHLIARIMESAINKQSFTLYGDDFNTPDGTCVRDYIHVYDVAGAVHNAVKRTAHNKGAEIFNVGNGLGYSNLDIINSINHNTDLSVEYIIGPRRAGDPDSLVADIMATENEMMWSPSLTLDDIVNSAYNYYKSNKELSA